MSKQKYQSRSYEQIEYDRREVARIMIEAVHSGTHSHGKLCIPCQGRYEAGEFVNGKFVSLWCEADEKINIPRCIWCAAAQEGSQDAIRRVSLLATKIPEF